MPINIYECFSMDSDEQIQQKEKSSSFLISGMIQYQLGNYENALGNFLQAQELSKDDPVSALHIKRCQDIISREKNK